MRRVDANGGHGDERDDRQMRGDAQRGATGAALTPSAGFEKHSEHGILRG